MSDTISGVIQQIKTKQTKIGTMYDIQVNGDFWGVGKYAPKAKEGDYVTFTPEYNGNFKNVERGTLKVSQHKPAGAGNASSAQQAVRSAANSFDARQDAISRQAASNTAIAWLTMLHTAGALPISTSKSKGGQQEALDVLRRQYEKEFYEANTGVEWKNISPNKASDASGDADDNGEEEAENDPWS